jgi:hypothetical protein
MQLRNGKSRNRHCGGIMRATGLAGMSAVLLAMFFLLPGSVRAQVATGDILGTVTDPMGAIIPDARVTILNTGTGISSAIKSDKTGEYLFANLQIGSYKLTVEAKGFKTFVVTGVTLNVGNRSRIDVKLEVGSQVETVQVKASAAEQLQTDSSEISALIPSEAISEMPTNGRNYYDLMGYAAGTTTASEANDPRTGSRPSMAFSANGQTSVFNNNMIDGMDNNQRSVGLVNVEPSLDALQEVKVETDTYSAEYSRTGGGIANLVTKAGTNQFHGTAFEFMRNDAFDAYAWEPAGTAKTKTELRQNQFGGSLGGPILKNKAFFFGDYQGWRHINAAVGNATVPTEAEYDSIHAYAAGTSSSITLSDPWQSGGLANTITIPGASINKLGLAYLMEAPKPTCDATNGHPSDTCNGAIAPDGTDTGTYNYTRASKANQKTNTYDARVDYHFNDSDMLFGRYSYNNTLNINGNGSVLPPVALVSGNSKLYSPGENDGAVTSQNVALDYLHIFSSASLFEGKASYSESYMNGYSANLAWSLSDVGIGCSTDYCYNSDGVYGLPFVSMSAAAFGTPYGPNPAPGGWAPGALAPFSAITGDPGESYFTENTFQYVASLTEVKKAHSMKMGVTLIRRQIKAPETSNSTPTFSAYYTPNVLGDMLEGNAIELAGSKVMVVPHYRMWEPSAFFQDNWRVTRSLTLNLGVRYDIYAPMTERSGDISNFDTTTDRIVSPDLLGANASSPTANIQTDFKDISPRLGFAYSLNRDNEVFRNMVIRGGFGISYFPGNTSGSNMLEYQMTNAPFIWSMSCGNGMAVGKPLVPCGMNYPSAAAGDGAGYNVASNLPRASYQTNLATDPTTYVNTFSSDQFIAPNFKPLYLEQFNLQVQKQLGQNIFTAGMVGSLGRRIPTQQNLNEPISDAALKAGIYPLATTNSYMDNVPVKTAFSGANSAWLSGEATFERRLSRGLSANINFTWSRSESQGTGSSECSVYGACPVDNGSGTAILLNSWKQYNYTGSTSHRAAGMLTYNIPAVQSWHSVLGAATKGWALNGTGWWQTGAWNPITSGVNISGMSSYGTEYPNRVPGVSVKLHHPTLSEWFNVSAFEQQTPGMLGNAYQNANYVQGPRARDADLSLGKIFSLYEGFKLQFRAEAFNVFNTPNYDPPPGPPPGGGGGGGGGEYAISSYGPNGIATNGSGFGEITSVANQSRIFQFGLKLIY